MPTLIQSIREVFKGTSTPVNPRLVEVKASPLSRVQAQAEGLLEQTKNTAGGLGTGSDYKPIFTKEQVGLVYQHSPVVRACADVLASYAAQVPLKIYTVDEQTGVAREDRKHFIGKTLRFINPRMSPSDFTATLVRYMVLYNHAYVAIQKTPKKYQARSPFALFTLNPRYVEITGDPSVPESVQYVYDPGGGVKPQTFSFDEIIEIPGFNPMSNFAGMLLIDTVEYDIKQEVYARNYLAQYYNKGVGITGYITLPERSEGAVDEATRDVLREELRRASMSSADKFNWLVLDAGQQLEVMKSPQIEVNVKPVLDSAQQTIAMVFGVPVGILTGNADNLEELEVFFWNKTIKHMLKRIEEYVNKRFVQVVDSKGEYEARFDYRGVAALKRELLNVARVVVALGNTGFITPNEGRTEFLTFPEFEGVVSDENDWGNAIVPLVMAKLASQASAATTGGTANLNGSSPSLSMTGSGGGRDQSANGEAQLIDTGGSKAFDTLMEQELMKALELFGKSNPDEVNL